MELVDSHCHLDDAQFDADRDEVMQRARDAGLRYMLAIGTGNGPPDLLASVRLADLSPLVLASVGVHPNDAPKVVPGRTFEDLERALAHPKVVGIGEIGLDYHWGVPKDVQFPIFVRQLEIASAARMPIIIHTRDAWEDTIDVLRSEWAPSLLPCVMHCFTGDEKQARECLDLGFHLAFGGVTTFPKAASIREAAKLLPADRILLETDSPYLAPAPYRGKRNEPAYVSHTAQVIADVRGIPVDELAAQTTANFERVFLSSDLRIH